MEYQQIIDLGSKIGRSLASVVRMYPEIGSQWTGIEPHDYDVLIDAGLLEGTTEWDTAIGAAKLSFHRHLDG